MRWYRLLLLALSLPIALAQAEEQPKEGPEPGPLPGKLILTLDPGRHTSWSNCNCFPLCRARISSGRSSSKARCP
jgi:hypothetical protein